jgi:peptidoglycan-associated lipoprotein
MTFVRCENPPRARRALRRAAMAAGALALLAGLPACVGTESAEAVAAAPVEATGAPVGAGIAVPPGSYEDFIVNVGRRIYFAEGSAELDDTARVTLKSQAEWLQRYTDYNVKIQGFSDDPGTPEQNRALGLRRADAARTYLASLGVPTSRMRTKTYGSAKERLTNDCDDRSCRAQNRRVHTVLEREAGV